MAYVSTDVDRILEYLKSRKKAELVEVARALGIRAMEVDKWAKILEKQGLISIQYDITKMYLVHNETQAKPDVIDKYIEDISKKQQDNIGVSRAKPEQPIPIKQPAILSKENVHMQNTTLPAKKNNPGFLHGGAFNLFILGKKPQAQSGGTDSTAKEPSHKKEQPAKSHQQPLKEVAHKTEPPSASAESKPAKRHDIITLPFITKSTKRAGTSMAAEDGTATEELKHRIDSINAAISEIADIRAEREKLYTTGYLPLISQLDAHVSRLNSKISEDAASISSLKSRIASIPDAVITLENDLKKSQDELKEIEKEHTARLKSVSQMRESIAQLREEIRADISKSRDALKASLDTLVSLDKEVSSAISFRNEALLKIKEANQKIEEERKVIEKMAALVDGCQIQIGELQGLISDIKGKAKHAEEDIRALEQACHKLDEAEEKLSKIATDYNKRISELRQHITAQDVEIRRMRSEIEREYVSRYIAELKKMSELHEKTAAEVIKKDQELDSRLKAARERLQQLLKESDR